MSGLVRNVHRRHFGANLDRVGVLLDSLAGPHDRLWPRDRWPAMRLDRGLQVGSRGGHGPIRYTVGSYEPARRVRFDFTAPHGFDGSHAFGVESRQGGSELHHTIEMHVHGSARFTWPLVFRPLHDALLEDLLDHAALALGEAPQRSGWSWWVRVLRRLRQPRHGRRAERPHQPPTTDLR